MTTYVGRASGRGPLASMTRRALLAGSAALACSAAGLPLARAAGKSGGTLVMTVFPEPNAMVGAFNTSGPLTIVSPKIHDGLCTYDFELNLKPHLATSWHVSADGKTIEFKLRQGVKWHDGKDFTSADVAFTITELLRKYHPRGRITFAHVTAAETPDPQTVVLRLSRASPAILSALASYESPMMPKHIYEGTDPLTNPNNNKPIGTGPFRFAEWERGSHITLERNPEYWDEGKPHLDRVVIRIVPDASGRAAALETGEIMLAGTNPIPLSDVARFRENKDFVLETRGEELNNNVHVIECNLRNPILQKVEVRQAMLHAINREALARAAWYGLAKPSDSPVPQRLKRFHADGLPGYPFDPKRANQLLDAAGYPRKGRNPRFKLRLDWLPYGETYQMAAEFIRQSMRQVGIDVEIRSVDVATYINRVYGDYDFDLNIFFATATADPTIGLQRFYYSKAIQKGSPFVNASGYSNPEMDGVLEAAAVEVDFEKRRALFAEFQKIAMQDLPVLPIVDLDFLTIGNAKVRDFMIRPEGFRDTFADVRLEA
jgi:peptide/nickel transport system substrate-binding protein